MLTYRSNLPKMGGYLQRDRKRLYDISYNSTTPQSLGSKLRQKTETSNNCTVVKLEYFKSFSYRV